MKQVQALLLENEGVSARRRLANLLEQQPDKAAQAGTLAAQAAQHAYQLFHVQSVHDFCRGIGDDLPKVVTDRLLAAIGPQLERTLAWSETLRGVTEERLVRECRLRIQSRDLRAAATLGLLLVGRARNPREVERLCTLLGAQLSESRTDQAASRAVVEAVAKKLGVDSDGASTLATVFLNAIGEHGATSFDRAGQSGTQQLTEAILSLRRYLPGATDTGEPTTEQLAAFRDEAHAILRASLWAGRPDDLIDALMILVEYCPIDPSPVKNVAGVEERMFLQLGPRARLTAVRSFVALGEIEPLRRAVLNLAETNPEHQAPLRVIAGVMGGLRSAEFYPWLSKALTRAAAESEEAMIVDALGRIASPDAVGLLMERLTAAVRKRTDPAQERRAMTLLTAFGRIARSPACVPPDRPAMIERIVQTVDVGERNLAFRAAFELFAVRLTEISPTLKAWAAERAVDAMWGQPMNMVPVGGPFGWREPMITVLRRLGTDSMPAIIAAAQKHVVKYSGAMGALGEVFAELGDPRALPLLETMLRVAFMYREDPNRSRLFDEKVLDAATGETRDLDRDDLIHTLLYSAQKCGGPAGQTLIIGYADQVQAGRVESPGGKTTGLLVDTKMKLGGGMQPSAPAKAQPREVYTEKEIRQAMSESRGGLLTKKEKRIAALATLGTMRAPESLPALIEAIGDKDAMISGAAFTALTQFVQPLPSTEDFTEFVDALVAEPKLLKGRALDQLLEFIGRELPKRPPYNKIYERQIALGLDDDALVHRFNGAMLSKAPTPPAAGAPGAATGEGAGPVPGSAPAGGAPAGGAARRGGELSAMDAKRAYMQARRAWLAGGKVGEAPVPPDGFTG